MPDVVVRFAPSPTGDLHIGSARTALFNFLYARHLSGKYLLRIEDTDRDRSTDVSLNNILEGLAWLGIKHDAMYMQSDNLPSHLDAAKLLIQEGKAYRCYCTEDEIETFKREHPYKPFQSPWRDSTELLDRPYSVRLKVSAGIVISFHDKIIGDLSINSSELGDFVLVRSSGIPTYNFAAALDDHTSKITDVIRGDDHITNTFKQILVFDAMKYTKPNFAHIPMIHNHEGKKLSKRDGATSVCEYARLGYLPEALLNYILRLGWGYKNQEIFSKEEAISLFSLDGIGKSPARFDMEKLNFLNKHYMNTIDEARLAALLLEDMRRHTDVSAQQEEVIKRAIGVIKKKGDNIPALAQHALLFLHKSKTLDDKSRALLTEYSPLLPKLIDMLENVASWNVDAIKLAAKNCANEIGHKPAVVMQLLRASVVGTFDSPSIIDMIWAMGKEEAIKRIKDAH